MNIPTDADHAAARECFRDFYVLGESFLAMADKTRPAGDLDEALAGQREPTVLAKNCREILRRVAQAIAAARGTA